MRGSGFETEAKKGLNPMLITDQTPSNRTRPRLLTGWYQVGKLLALHPPRSLSGDGHLGNPEDWESGVINARQVLCRGADTLPTLERRSDHAKEP